VGQLAGDPREVEARLQLKSQVEPFAYRSAQFIKPSFGGRPRDTPDNGASARAVPMSSVVFIGERVSPTAPLHGSPSTAGSGFETFRRLTMNLV
jgi:hypothetical protein